MANSEKKQSLVLFKPDSLKNSMSGYLLTLLSEFNTGLTMAGLKMVQVNKILAEEHYVEHKGKGFFPAVVEYIMGKSHFPEQPEKQWVIALVFEGENAIKKIRDIAGPTNPLNARTEKPGCIRSMGAIIPVIDESGAIIDNRIDNLMHASSSDSDAEREVKLWFKPDEIPAPLRAYPTTECKSYYYYKDSSLSNTYSDGSICLMAPGDIAWTSDLDSLHAIIENKPASVSLDTIAAKYCVNH